jgi:ABC-2 type transport system ATP-binding protein
MLTNSLDAAVAQRIATQASPHSEPATDSVVSITGLRKRYGDVEAVRGIDLEVHRGEIFAFLGPNGAGKTTTVEILEGFRQAGDGIVRVLGEDPWHAPSSWRERIGIVLQESAPEPSLTVRECLELYAGYYRAPRRVDDTLGLVDLTAQSEERATALSGGQRRRLDVALALIGDGELIFLDEPTTGFDPSARRASWDVIAGLRDLGKTVFLTTHYMEEAERLADRIAVIAEGEIVAEGTPKTLGGRQLADAEIAFALPPGTAASDLPDSLSERVHGDGGGRLVLPSASVTAELHALSGWALDRDLELDDLEVTRPTLEDVYLRLTADHRPRS